MKRYEVETTIYFKRSRSYSLPQKEVYLLPDNENIETTVKEYHWKNGNHVVSRVNVISVKDTDYKLKCCIYRNKKGQLEWTMLGGK